MKTILLTVLLLGASFANANQKDLEGSINKLINIVNYSIPQKYRDQLNPAIKELISAAQNQCVSSNTVAQPTRSNCKIERDLYNNSFYVARGTTMISQYYRSSPLTSKNDFDALVASGLCTDGSVASICTVEKDLYNNSFYVSRDSRVFSQYNRSSALTSADDLAALRAAGLCN